MKLLLLSVIAVTRKIAFVLIINSLLTIVSFLALINDCVLMLRSTFSSTAFLLIKYSPLFSFDIIFVVIKISSSALLSQLLMIKVDLACPNTLEQLV